MGNFFCSEFLRWNFYGNVKPTKEPTTCGPTAQPIETPPPTTQECRDIGGECIPFDKCPDVIEHKDKNYCPLGHVCCVWLT